jgi:hypothetical protein
VRSDCGLLRLYVPEISFPGWGRVETSKTVADILGRGESLAAPWEMTQVWNADRAAATPERAERAAETLGAKTPLIMVYYGSDGAG